jgi:hypothetical protein
MTGIKPALQAANGKTAEQMPTMMQKTCNAEILYATNPQMFMIQQGQQQKIHAQIPLTTTAT